MPDTNQNLSSVERIKMASNGLRGTIKESVANELTGSVPEGDANLFKFHGMYQQDDRDRRDERAQKKLERLYSFMIRLRLPGGFMTSEQWLGTHDIAGKNATGIIKITTRQTIQLHGLLKRKIKPTIKAFNLAKLDSIATCGDVNRNVICAAHPKQSPVHAQIFAYADKISEALKPKTRAYYEIWLDEEKLSEKTEEDPLYQDRYLPRKFKIGIGIPPNNDVDVMINDLALIAIVENDELKGFNIAVGGGLSSTHGNPEHYPRLATVIGFTDTEEKIMKVIYEILTVQRDFGDRSDRKKARIKYTIDSLGVDVFKKEVEKRVGFELEASKPFAFTERKDLYGWEQSYDGLWYYTVFLENGRVLDHEDVKLKTAFYEIAKTGKANFRFTCNQNLILSDITDQDKNKIETILKKYGVIDHTNNASAVRKNSIACVALNTCPLALAEAQRYLPTLISKIEPLLKKYDLYDEQIIIRMTGCPNGCGRSPNAEIGLIGTALGKYNLHIGGDHLGLRLNRKYKDSLNEEEILTELDSLFEKFKDQRINGERFGDFTDRFLSSLS
jgi:sulfite reductase (NADPH) hemoprotein beta-component